MRMSVAPSGLNGSAAMLPKARKASPWAHLCRCFAACFRCAATIRLAPIFVRPDRRTPILTKTLNTITALILLLAITISAESKGNFDGQTRRPLRYQPVGTDFVIENGVEFFNRPLYGTNTAFRVDAGDRPEFSLYLPGRGGNLRLAIKTDAGQKWLFGAEHILTRYRPGSMLYEINDPLLAGGTLKLALLAMSATEGLVLRVELIGTSRPVELIWAYGGVSGERGRRDGDIGTESVPISKYFQLKPESCRDNTFAIEGNTFTLRSKPATIRGLAPNGARLTIADATKWSLLADLISSADQANEMPVIVGRSALPVKQPIYLGLQRISDSAASQEELDTYKEVRKEPPEQTRPPLNANLVAAYKVEDLPRIFDDAERRRRAIAEQVVADTPDPFINAAIAALTVAADGVWDEPAGTFMHGAVAWRSRLLGWRGAYSGDALGWHDRALRHLAYWAGRQNTAPVSPTLLPSPDSSVNFARNEPALHTNGDLSNSHYDMNLVYIDALFRHFLWTGDLEFARAQWPVIERHLAWERRLFRRSFGPDQLPLYDAYAAIWASDDLQYEGGGVTHSTAYNYYHNRMAARIARLLGKDSNVYDREAELILKAMRRELWLADRGWFAEWKDLLGLQLVHPNAGLWTFYHTVDSEVTTPLEAWQMSRFVDTQNAHIPIHGPSVPEAVPEGNYFTLPTTSWMPYTWSINNVVMAEVAHTSLGYWKAGRSDPAFKLFKGGILDSMFMGLCPGNAGMTTQFDMARGESQRDFGDAAGTLSRTLIEGLYGVQPDVLAGELRIQPGFPSTWNHASLRHPDFQFVFQRRAMTETYTVESRFSKPMRLRLRVPAMRDGIARVTVNGQPARWQIVPDSVGFPSIEIQSQDGPRYKMVITWKGEKPAQASVPPIVAEGTELTAQVGAARLIEVADPQSSLGGLTREMNSFRAVAAGTRGHRTVFARVQQGSMNWWQPLTFEIRPAYEILQIENQDASHVRFKIRNNTPTAINREVTIKASGVTTRAQLKLAAFGSSNELALASGDLLPGSNPIEVELEKSTTVTGVVTNWKLKADGTSTRWDSLDLTPVFNDRVTRIFKNEYLNPRSPYATLAIPKQGIGSWTHFEEQFEVDDTGLRAIAGRNGGRFILPQGVPFQTPASIDIKNIAFTSQWDNYPREINIPLSGRSSHVYLLMAGSTNWMQSRFDNGEVVVTYTDGSTARLALNNPVNWWPIDQDYFIDDYAFRRPEPISPRVDLKTGAVRTFDLAEFKGKGGKILGGAATVLDLPLDRGRELKSLKVRTLANEVVIGLMGVTLARK